MKSTIQIKLALTASLLFVTVLSDSAYGSACTLRTDTISNTKLIGEFIKKEKSPFKQVSLNSNSYLVDKYIKINRDSADYPELQILNAGGILTASPNVDVNKIRNSQQGYGQVIQVTKCHWMTNLHVAEGVASERGEQVQVGTEAYGSFGQGQTCDGKDGFKVVGAKSKLVAFNKNAYFVDKNGEQKIDDSKDWAVFQTGQPLAGIPVAPVSKYEFLFGRSAILAGNPIEKLDNDGFGLIGVSVVEAQASAGPGVMVLGKQPKQGGRSGSGIYIPDEEEGLVLAAIYVGGGKVLNVLEILKQLKANNPAVFKDMVRVLQGGTCNSI